MDRERRRILPVSGGKHPPVSRSRTLRRYDARRGLRQSWLPKHGRRRLRIALGLGGRAHLAKVETGFAFKNAPIKRRPLSGGKPLHTFPESGLMFSWIGHSFR